jgi:hypothetical protein
MLKSLIPHVLQEPFGRNLAPLPGTLGRFVDEPCNREKLRALQIAALGIGDLVARGAPLFGDRSLAMA